MALAKEIIIDPVTGVNASYIRIETALYDANTKVMKIDLGLYLSEGTRRAGKKPLRVISYDIKVKEEVFPEANVLEFGYMLLKTLPDLSDAMDK